MAQLDQQMDELHWLPVPLDEGGRQLPAALAQPGDDWIVFAQPCLGVDRPDFIAVQTELGVTVVEVKDWSPGCYRAGAARMLSGSWWLSTRPCGG